MDFWFGLVETALHNTATQNKMRPLEAAVPVIVVPGDSDPPLATPDPTGSTQCNLQLALLVLSVPPQRPLRVVCWRTPLHPRRRMGPNHVPRMRVQMVLHCRPVLHHAVHHDPRHAGHALDPSTRHDRVHAVHVLPAEAAATHGPRVRAAVLRVLGAAPAPVVACAVPNSSRGFAVRDHICTWR
ncbi:hypothetical protein BC828DRAFT_93767 [Blastocladiella britannica]|nr:hypothetical protein BC828DRAFT_93767 [Blastocladiella britannica]